MSKTKATVPPSMPLAGVTAVFAFSRHAGIDGRKQSGHAHSSHMDSSRTAGSDNVASSHVIQPPAWVYGVYVGALRTPADVRLYASAVSTWRRVVLREMHDQDPSFDGTSSWDRVRDALMRCEAAIIHEEYVHKNTTYPSTATSADIHAGVHAWQSWACSVTLAAAYTARGRDA